MRTTGISNGGNYVFAYYTKPLSHPSVLCAGLALPRSVSGLAQCNRQASVIIKFLQMCIKAPLTEFYKFLLMPGVEITEQYVWLPGGMF